MSAATVNMETRRTRCPKSAAGEEMSKVPIEQYVDCPAEGSHAPYSVNQEVELVMEAIRSTKTEVYPYHTEQAAHTVQEFIPVPQTDDFIKTELILDEESIDKMSDSEENGKQLVQPLADDQQAKASKSDKEVCGSRRSFYTKGEMTQKSHPTFNCVVCGNSFASLQSRKIHMLRKHLDKLQSNISGSRTADNDSIDSQMEEFLDKDATYYGQESAAKGSESQSDIKSETCEVCHCIFPTTYIRMHKRLAHSKLKYKCQVCSHSFKNKHQIERHLSIHATNRKREFICDVCERAYYSKAALVMHMRTYAKKDHPKFDCEVCWSTFTRKGQLDLHMSTKHSDQSQPITQAAQTADHNSMNTNQMLGNKQTEGKKFQCGVCSRTFKTKTNLKTHAKIHNKDRKPEFACDSCDSAFYTNSTLWKHKKKDHNSDTCPCKLCDQRKESLKVHMLHRQHINETHKFRPQPSNDAGVPMKIELTSDEEEEFIDEGKGGDSVAHAGGSQQPAIVADDERSVRVGIAEDSVSCEICRNSFPGQLIETHMRNTHGDATYKCQLCPRIFLHKSELTSHIRSHDDKGKHKRQFACELCGCKFLFEESVKRHMAFQHTKNRLPEFNCEFCEKKFYTKESFEQHKRTHNDDAMSCGVCGARFTHGDSLKYHMLHEHTDTRKQLTPNPPTANYDFVHTKKESTSDEEFLGGET